MYKICTTEKSAAQQRAVELCLMDAMQRQSFEEITVMSLCEQSGISRRNFYRLFDNKDDVLNALIDHTIVDYSKFDLPADQIHSDIPKELLLFFTYWYQQKPLLDVLQKNHLSNLLLERCMMHVASEDPQTMRMIGADNLKKGIETLVFFMHGFIGLVVYWHHSGYEKTIGEMSSIAQELFSNPPVRFPDLFKHL